MAHNGIVYLLHFDRSYRHARHYIGFTQNLEQRLAEHRAGRGSPLIAAAIADGIDFELAAIWEGDRHDERRLHRQKNTRARLCPICVAGDSRRGAREPTVDLVDELLLSVLGGIPQPATLTALQAQLRRRGKRVGSVHGRLELLALRGRVSKTWLLGEIAWTTVTPRPTRRAEPLGGARDAGVSRPGWRSVPSQGSHPGGCVGVGERPRHPGGPQPEREGQMSTTYRRRRAQRGRARAAPQRRARAREGGRRAAADLRGVAAVGPCPVDVPPLLGAQLHADRAGLPPAGDRARAGRRVPHLAQARPVRAQGRARHQDRRPGHPQEDRPEPRRPRRADQGAREQRPVRFTTVAGLRQVISCSVRRCRRPPRRAKLPAAISLPGIRAPGYMGGWEGPGFRLARSSRSWRPEGDGAAAIARASRRYPREQRRDEQAGANADAVFPSRESRRRTVAAARLPPFTRWSQAPGASDRGCMCPGAAAGDGAGGPRNRRCFNGHAAT